MPNRVPTTGKLTAEPGRVARVAHQRRQMPGPRHQLDVDVAVELVEGGEPGGGGHRVAGERPGVEHRAERRQVLHQIGPTADRTDRETTADHLAEARQVGRHVVLRLGAARPDPEAGDHLVEDEQRTDTVALGTQPVEEARRRCDDAHVRGDRLDDDRRDLRRRAPARRCTARPSSRPRRRAARRRCPGRPERRDTAAACDEQRVGGAVEVAGERDDAVATGRPSCQPHRRAGGLGTGVHESHPLATRHPLADRLGELHLAWRRRTERRSVDRGTAAAPRSPPGGRGRG